MPVKTLSSLALQMARANADRVQDIGDAPYALVRPILLAVQDPAQLYKLEQNCPHIALADEELWRAFIIRDIKDGEWKLQAPRNGLSWWKTYYMLKAEDDKAKEAGEAALAKTLAGLDREREAKKVEFTGTVMPQKRRRTTQAYSATTGGATGTSMQALKGQKIMDKIRKEGARHVVAQNRRLFHDKGQLAQFQAAAKAQIRTAPASMLQEQRLANAIRAADLKTLGVKPLPPKMTPPSTTATASSTQRIKLKSTTIKRPPPLTLVEPGNFLDPEPPVLKRKSPPLSPGSIFSGIRPQQAKKNTPSPPPINIPPDSAANTSTNISTNTATNTSTNTSTTIKSATGQKRPNPSIFMPAKKRRV